MDFKKSEEIVKYVGEKYPHTKNNNTESVIYSIEELARRKGFELVGDEIWTEVKEIMRTSGYNIQSIMRSRFKIYGTSEEQKNKEVDFINYNFNS